MHGSLCLKNGILYVARHAVTAHVRPYDLDGHPLGPGFSFRGAGDRAASASGIDLDEDHRVWIADSAGERLLAFSLFGRELPTVADSSARPKLEPGRFESIVDVAARGVESDLELLIVRGGQRRRALELVHVASGRVRSLRSDGDPQESFDGLQRASIRDRMIYACEAGAGRVQVFRDGEFHYLFRLPIDRARGARFVPRSIAPLADGRMVIALGGGESSALVLVAPGGRLVRVLAEPGESTGSVFEQTDVAIDEGESDHRTRVAVIDADGDRVQVFTLEGECFGAFADLPRGNAENSSLGE